MKWTRTAGNIVYCYCLMDNHTHLLINDNGNDISKLNIYIGKALNNHEFLDTGKILASFSDHKNKPEEYVLFTKRYGEKSETILEIKEYQ